MKTTTVMKDVNCIWVGIDGIESKLCDRNFDCDGCEFNAMMTNRSQSIEDDEKETDLLNSLLQQIQSEEYFPAYIYLKNNLYMKKLLGNTFYIGFSPVINGFLSDVRIIHPDCKGTIISRGDPLLQIAGEWGSFMVPAPMDMVCLCKIDTDKSNGQPLNWFGMVEVSGENVAKETLSERDYNKKKKKLLKQLSVYDISKQDVGVTLYDGANKVSHLSELMGVNAYVRFLLELFSIT